MPIKILITGGSGFIGTNIVQYYLDSQFEVLNIDIVQPKFKNHNSIWHNVDINNYQLLYNEIKNFEPEYVIHLAARTDLDGKDLKAYDSNILGVDNLVKVLTQINSVKRVVFTSSMLVCEPGYIPKSTTEYAPSTIYGESKVLTEEIIRKLNLSFEWAIVRPTSIWGPWFNIPYRNFFEMLINKRYFHIGNKACTKTYGYIGNIIYQIDCILHADKTLVHKEVFYLGDYKPTNIKDWANEISAQLNFSILTVPYPIVKMAALFGDMLKALKLNFPMTSFRLKNMTTNNVVNLSNIEKIAPSLPYNREEGIKITLKWLKDNK